MNTNAHPRSTLAAALLCLAALSSAQARERNLLPLDRPQAYTQECAACHTAYPPGLLPAASWQRVMNGLDTHYGTDASLAPATRQQIAGWLQAHAGSGRRASEAPPQDRITRSAWFVREHRKVDAAVWDHASVGSAANCGACHASADQGNYDDDELRWPPGLAARHRRAWND